MLLMIDNYDSFTYNLVQYFQILKEDVQVYYHDQINLTEIEALNPDYLVISPGPKDPSAAGISVDVIQHFYTKIPILGVCLGHQCLAHAFGGHIISAPTIIHGKTSRITHDHRGLFEDLPNHFAVTRYHSLAVDPQTLPECFTIDAWATDDNSIMAISHLHYPVYGIQFHPEAILTEYGFPLLARFLSVGKKTNVTKLKKNVQSDIFANNRIKS